MGPYLLRTSSSITGYPGDESCTTKPKTFRPFLIVGGQYIPRDPLPDLTLLPRIDSAKSQAAIDSNAENLQSFAANQLGRAYQLVANPAAERVYVYIGRHKGKHIGSAFSDVFK